MLKPRVKRSLDPMRLAGGSRIRIGTFQEPIAFDLDDPTGVIWSLLKLLDGTRSVEEAVDIAAKAFPDFDPTSLLGSVEKLLEAGVCEAASSMPEGLTPHEVDRTSRSVEYLSWIDTERRSSRWETQLRLKQSRVVVVGLGGAGSSVAMALAASGVGELVVLDCDLVESSNLNRQLLYTESDIGRPKVEVAIERLSAMNRYSQVTGHSVRITSPDVLAQYLDRASMLVLCADTPKGTIVRWANSVALETGLPWLVAGYAGPMAVVSTYIPFATGCAECELLARTERRVQHPDYDVGEHLFSFEPINAVMAPTAAITGHIAALEVIHVLTGIPARTCGRTLNLNMMLHDDVSYFDNPRRSDCPVCARVPDAQPNVV